MHMDHPYTDMSGGEWLRGNLHTHTTASDGARPQQEVIDDYSERGYDFLSISDHDVYTGPDDYAKWDSRGMVMIPGNEISANGPHLLHVNCDRLLEPTMPRQITLDAITECGGFAVMNHPNWHGNFSHYTIEQLTDWTGYAGIEIYNGVVSRLEGSPYATNKWDMLLNGGRRVWGFANDDSHLAVGEVGRGWNMVYAAERSVDAICEAIVNGRFYPSTGVVIDRIEVEDNHIHISAGNAARIVALRQGSARIAHVDGPVMDLIVPDGATVIRFECWGTGEQMAWTQPFFVGA